MPLKTLSNQSTKTMPRPQNTSQNSQQIVFFNQFSVHSLDELVDEILAVAMVTTLDEVPGLLSVATSGIAQLERPKEVVGLFEVRAHRDYLVDEVLNTDDTKLAQSLH